MKNEFYNDFVFDWVLRLKEESLMINTNQNINTQNISLLTKLNKNVIVKEEEKEEINEIDENKLNIKIQSQSSKIIKNVNKVEIISTMNKFSGLSFKDNNRDKHL